MNRTEHVEQVKEHVLAALETDGVIGALVTVFEELPQHPETQNHAGLDLLALLTMSGAMSQEWQVREFVDGMR